MAPTPTWQAATAGQPPQAAHIGQFLGTHAIQNLYAATLQASQTTAGGTSTPTNGQYLAQRFTTGVGQTTVGYVSIPLTTTITSGANLAPITISLFSDNAGVPSSTALVTVTATAEYANLESGGTATVSVIYPLPATGLAAATQYWIVTSPAGTGGSAYTWFRSNQVSGAFTSTNGTTWTGQAYGLLFKVYDQTAAGLLTCTWEDSGARWTARGYGATSLVTTYAEYTAGQTASGYLQSYRTLGYTSGLVTGVS